MAGSDLVLLSNGSVVTLSLTKTSLWLKTGGKSSFLHDDKFTKLSPPGEKISEAEVAFRQVISAKTQVVQESHFLEVYYVARKKKRFSLQKLDGKINDDHKGIASEWVESLMQVAYDGMGQILFLQRYLWCCTGVKNGRRLKVLVNPHGGPVWFRFPISSSTALKLSHFRGKRAQFLPEWWNPFSELQIVHWT